MNFIDTLRSFLTTPQNKGQSFRMPAPQSIAQNVMNAVIPANVRVPVQQINKVAPIKFTPTLTNFAQNATRQLALQSPISKITMPTTPRYNFMQSAGNILSKTPIPSEVLNPKAPIAPSFGNFAMDFPFQAAKSAGNTIKRIGEGNFAKGGIGNFTEDASNVASVLPIGAVLRTAKPEISSAIRLANRAGTFEEFSSLLRKAEPEAKMFVGGILKNKKNAINTTEDFFKAVKSMEVPQLRAEVKPGSFSNLTEADNPLIERGAQRAVGRQLADPLPSKNNFEDWVNRSVPDVKTKVGLLDYIRTPDRVLEKIGLGQEAKLLRTKHEDYLKELPMQIDTITKWAKRVAQSNQVIFQYLDGKPVKLTRTEMEVAQEIKGYLSTWADRLNLPKEGRITNYITHIYDKDFIQKEFDPELAKIIRDKVPGSVYDPFTEKRLGKLGYKEDTWQALDAYVKRATRKVHMDEALERVQSAAEGLEESKFQYVKKYIDKVNLRPGELDNLLDNTIKQVAGYRFGQRPTAALTRTGRQWVYRATLGLNPGSALRNLSQGANTYAKLGEKYTTIGYSKALKAIISNDNELERVGILADDIIQDRVLSSSKKFLQKMDKGLFVFFETAEKINRGAAYFGAKAKALNKGMNEEQAIEFAKKVVRDTQFTFGNIDTPMLLQGDINKTLLQFQSYNLKQAEFLVEMLKAKDVAGIVRYSAASMAFVFTLGKLIGMKPEQIIPFVGSRFQAPPTLQLPIEVGKAVVGAKDEWGNEVSTGQRALNIADKAGLFIPGYTQAKKTFQGIEAVNQGYDKTSSGRVRFPIEKTTSNMIRAGLFGKYNLPEAKAYRDAESSELGDKQSEEYRNLPREKQTEYYKSVMDKRVDDKQVTAIKEKMKASNEAYSQDEKRFFVKTISGDISTIDKQTDLNPPKATGNALYDRQNLEAYRTKVEKRIRDSLALAEAGAISQSSAEAEITRLLPMYNSLRDVLNKTRTKDKEVTDFTQSRETSNISAQENLIYRKVQKGELTPSQGEVLLKQLQDQSDAITAASKARKGRKPKKLKFRKYKIKAAKIPKVKKPKKVKLKALQLNTPKFGKALV